MRDEGRARITGPFALFLLPSSFIPHPSSLIPHPFLAEPTVAEDPRVEQLLDEICESGSTPEEVCRACPELLPEVRRRWLEMRILDAELDVLFPVEPSSISEGGP